MAAKPCRAPEMHALGDIVAAFGNLEFFVEVAIWHLLGAEDRKRSLMAQAVTAEMSFDRKVHALASMFREKYGKVHEKELAAVVKSLFAAQDERNALLHSAWNYSDNFRALVRMKASAKARGGLQRRLHRMTIDRLEAIRRRIAAAGEAISKFTMSHIQEQSEASGRTAG